MVGSRMSAYKNIETFEHPSSLNLHLDKPKKILGSNLTVNYNRKIYCLIIEDS